MRKITFFLLLSIPLCSLTIEEKKESFFKEEESGSGFNTQLEEVNQKLAALKAQLRQKYLLVTQYCSKDAEPQEFEALLQEVKGIKSEIAQVENRWHQISLDQAKKEEEGYSLWDQDETSLSDLVMEYGSSDYLYVVPPEMANMKLNIHSAIPIARESWSELLEIILGHNGIGVKQLNPYTRQLFIMKQDLIAVSSITNTRSDLAKIPSQSRIAHIFSPSPERIKGVSHFFERFRDPKTTFVYQVGYKIAIVAAKEEVEKLLTLYDAVWEKESEKISKVIPLTKIGTKEMEKILAAYFGETTKKPRNALSRGEGDDLIMMPVGEEGSLAIIGIKELVEKAEKVIRDTEAQMENPNEMTVYWYSCRHSDPIEVSEVLEKVYFSLIYTGVEGQSEVTASGESATPVPPPFQVDPDRPIQFSPPKYGTPPYSPVAHPHVALASTADWQKEKAHTTNFIPSPKTGSIMMVVRRDTLPKIKELLRKLDVPKKMVQIEVLLFEKQFNQQTNFGLNILKLGDAAQNVHETGLSYENLPGIPNRGIVEFFISREKSSHFPAFDLAYNFLLSQEDVQVNASPTILTLNQTPGQISIVEEISINNGAAPVDSNQGVIFEKSYSRAQYGTTIVITPTIHEPLDGGEKRFITLETDISFETTKSDEEDRPIVNRRHVDNQVRVLDGETVILGGLRKKTAEDRTEKVPFLGELPGIAKFFGTSRLRSQTTEMFIFITPHVVSDDNEELDRLRCLELMKRPGDLPQFLERINEAKEKKKKRLFEQSLNLLFGNIDCV